MNWLAALALAAVPYPTPPAPPPTTLPSDVAPGECRLDGYGLDAETPTLIVLCGISTDVDRLFEIELSDADLWFLARLIEVVDEAESGDEITVH